MTNEVGRNSEENHTGPRQSEPTDPNASEIFAGIAGLELPVDEFDFGEGVRVRRTYAHVMAPYLAAFSPAKPGKPHPAPWKAVSGGFSFDIQAELHVPLNFTRRQWFDRLNTVWWLLSLIRIRTAPNAVVPVIASMPFAEIPSAECEPRFWPLEMSPHRLVAVRTHGSSTVADLEWIRLHWLQAGALMGQNEDFNVAFQAFDHCIWSSTVQLGLLSLWAALERLFSPSRAELCFRIPAAIATFLEPPGKSRYACHKSVKKLYDARSGAAHGRPTEVDRPFVETHSFLRKVLLKIIEEDHVPSQTELEARLFGSEEEIPG